MNASLSRELLKWIIAALPFLTCYFAVGEVTVQVTAVANASEPSSPGTILITADRTLASPLTVYYTVGGYAASGRNYVGLPGYATIPTGQSGAPIIITPINNPVYET